RDGAATRKFDACRRAGAAAAWAGGMRGAMLWMESASGTTEPVTGPPVSTGDLNLRLIVVGGSGSSASVASDPALKPVAAPSVCSRLASRFALAASPPPPAPKIDPMNAVTAMTSLTVAGGRLMLFAAQYALMPSA